MASTLAAFAAVHKGFFDLRREIWGRFAHGGQEGAEFAKRFGGDDKLSGGAGAARLLRNDRARDRRRLRRHLVAYEPCEYHNKVRLHHNLTTETDVKLLSRCEILISGRELFKCIELARIHPGFSSGRPVSDENDLVMWRKLQRPVL